MEHIGPFLFNGIRSYLGAGTISVILLVSWLIRRRSGSTMDAQEPREQPQVDTRYLLTAGLVCGLALFAACNAQQIGLVYVSASKTAFITTLYIVLVPLLGLFLKQRSRWNTWVSVGIAVLGLYLLCISDSLVLERGDAVVLFGALFWALHILVVGHYAPRLTLVQLFGLCAIQFVVVGTLSFAIAPCADHLIVPVEVSIEMIGNAAPELLYAGILSTAVAYVLVAIGQRNVKPTQTALILSTESVFALLGGVILLGETLTQREAVGCLLLLSAVILTQLDFAEMHKR